MKQSRKPSRRSDVSPKAARGAKPAAGPARPGSASAEGAPAASERRWRAVVGPGGASRADAYVAESSGVLSRSQIKARSARIRVNGADAKPSRPLKEGDVLEVVWTEDPADPALAEDLPLSMLYEDERVVVVDKAQGMVTHPGAGNKRGTLANALLFLALNDSAHRATPARGERAAREAPARAGIVHRLDKDTSGVIIAAKDLEAQAFLASQFKERQARKEYLAIVHGKSLPDSGRISDRLGRDRRDRKRFASVPEGGKIAVTEYRVLRRWPASSGGPAGGGEAYALVSLRPRTGRTHQLRVHMAGLGAPILGDPIYGRADGRFPEATLMLHAYRLKIALPGRTDASLFVAPVPKRFRQAVAALDAAFGPRRRPAQGRAR